MSTTNQTKHLLQILETLPGAVFVLDDTDTIVYANANAQAMAGTTPEEVVGTSLWSGAPHLVSASLYQTVLQARQTQEPTDAVYVSPVMQRGLHVHLAPTEEGLTLLFQQERAPERRQETLLSREHHAVAVLNDVQIRFALLTPEGILLEINETPLEQAHIRREQVLGKPLAEAEIHSLIDAIPQLIWILRSDGFSEYGNQRWCDYTGMTREQYQGDGWLQAVHPDDYQHTLTLWHHACVSGEPFEIEYRLKEGKTGAYRWFLARALPVRDEAGQILKWFGTSTDIDEQKRLMARAFHESCVRKSLSASIGLKVPGSKESPV